MAVEIAQAADASLSRAGGPLRREGRWVRVAPFALIFLVAVVLTLLPTGAQDAETAHAGAAVGAAALFAFILLAALTFPWERWPPTLQALVPLAAMIVILLLRHSQGSGDAGYTVLYILPVAWLALYSPTWQLVAGYLLTVAMILLPPWVDGPTLGEQHYPAEDYVLTVIVLLIIAFVAASLRFATDAASIDVLTGLPNRRVFVARLRHRAASGSHRAGPFSIAILDLDHFKQFNDSRGHDAGDQLLESTAAEWRLALRDRDILARIGGEEFGLLVDGDAATCRAVAGRLISSVPEGQTASAGVAEAAPGEDFSDLMRRADRALYAAKGAGRARVTEASP